MEGTIVLQKKRIWYRIINQEALKAGKPLVIMLHEGLGCSAQWRDIPETIAVEHQLPVLLYDRYGYGLSEMKKEANNTWYMHNEAYLFLPELLDKLNVYQKTILFGHSDGGTIALLFAARFPERSLAVITECDHVVCEDVTLQGVQGVVDAYELGKLKKMLEGYHGNKTNYLFYGWTGFWLSEKAAAWSITDELPKIKAPLLAIQGMEDNYGTVEQLMQKLKLCTGSVQVNHLAGCGHVPHHEAHDRVLSLINCFINRHINA
jgi:pimeloyl-ACP methyl ester carboxylesterase